MRVNDTIETGACTRQKSGQARGCTSALLVRIAPHPDDAPRRAAPQLPPRGGDQHSNTANAVCLPAVQSAPCQGHPRLGIQGKGTDLAIIMPCPEYTCAKIEHIMQMRNAVYDCPGWELYMGYADLMMTAKCLAATTFGATITPGN